MDSEPQRNWLEEIQRLLPQEAELKSQFDRLWPICRSITGNGLRQSFKILSEILPLDLLEVASGTTVFDWKVPNEWNIEDAYVDDESGRRLIDFRKNNLHVLNYSVPVDCWLTLEELQNHLHSLPDQPEAVPYLTSYYQERWGFCMADRDRRRLQPGRYHAVVRSTLAPGSLTLGHKLLPATEPGSTREIMLATYLCHPSLANNELSGPLVTSFLYKALAKLPRRRFNYRFVIAPETIGSISYLAKYGDELKNNLYAGFVVTCVGDGRAITYKKSRLGGSPADRAALRELAAYGKPFTALDFFPTGSDERQYCSPGFNLPVGSLMRSMYGTYPEYHTSLDNGSFTSFAAMRESIELYLRTLLALEFNEIHKTKVPFCEPMLGPRGLFPTLGSQKELEDSLARMMWILNLADGQHDLIAVAEKAKCSVLELEPIVQTLRQKGLLG